MYLTQKKEQPYFGSIQMDVIQSFIIGAYGIIIVVVNRMLYYIDKYERISEDDAIIHSAVWYGSDDKWRRFWWGQWKHYCKVG